ncbi:DUF1385 domain-containing protein [Anaerolentibacter hominis]|uniref:DUF1385 domain-containing protein n=1 Tax=Anaerolentibacter hominis TaxID=3079009 RepID=UPI0031B84057
MKPSGIGGQAVIEGVMMKNGAEYAVAVRKPDNEIVVQKDTFVSASEKIKLFKLPIFRGMLMFVESLVLGTRTLTFSASFFEEEEEKTQAEKKKGKAAEKLMMGFTVFISILLAVAIFMMLPYFLSTLLGRYITNTTVLVIIEGVIRVTIFILYVFLISLMKEIKRVFMYHGAEHKSINCIENGLELTVENVRGQSRQHKRCGTSFMLVVMFVSILLFMFIRVESPWLRILYRLLLIPVISGISYEFIRFAGRSNSRIIAVLSKPGLWLQGLTTREPDDEMIEVAIASVNEVFDWKAFLAEGDFRPERSKRKKAGDTQPEEKNEREPKPALTEVPAQITEEEQEPVHSGHKRHTAVPVEEIAVQDEWIETEEGEIPVEEEFEAVPDTIEILSPEEITEEVPAYVEEAVALEEAYPAAEDEAYETMEEAEEEQPQDMGEAEVSVTDDQESEEEEPGKETAADILQDEEILSILEEYSSRSRKK